jgi:hypothetical protein
MATTAWPSSEKLLPLDLLRIAANLIYSYTYQYAMSRITEGL